MITCLVNATYSLYVIEHSKYKIIGPSLLFENEVGPGVVQSDTVAKRNAGALDFGEPKKSKHD